MTVPPATTRERSRRALAQTALVGLAAASIAVIAGPATQAATPPAAPNNIVVFPQRDFVTIEGYQGRVGQQATVTVTRGGVETSRAVGRVAAGDVALEINHPGGVCWQGVTPDIKPGDVVRVTFPGGASDSTRTQRPAVTPQADGTGFSKVGAFDLVVEGRRGTIPLARIEQRIVNPDMDPTDIGRRDIRAPSRPGPYTSTLTAPTATTFRATYHFVTDGDTTAAEATAMRDLAAEGQMRALSWQVTDAADNRQGLTISEFGELGGPGMGGCPQGPSTAAPNAPTGVTATAGNQSATASWNPATTIPDGSPIIGYKVTAVNTTSNVETSVNVPPCTTGCTATVPNLTNGATYRMQVRALSEAGGLSQPGTAPGTLSPAGVGAGQAGGPDRCHRDGWRRRRPRGRDRHVERSLPSRTASPWRPGGSPRTTLRPTPASSECSWTSDGTTPRISHGRRSPPRGSGLQGAGDRRRRRRHAQQPLERLPRGDRAVR